MNSELLQSHYQWITQPTDSAKVLAIISLKRNLEETCCVILRVHNDHHDSHVYFHQMV